MKTKFFKSWLMLCLLLVGVGSAWGESVKYTWTYSSSTFNVSASSGTAPVGSTATLSSTYSSGNQLTGGKTQTFTLTGYDDCTITGVTINMKRTNSTSAKANITVSANGSQIGSSSALELTTSQADYPITVTSTKVGTSKDVVITVTAAANSIYVYSYTITYSGSNKTSTTTTFGNDVDNKTFNYTQGDAGFTKTATLSPDAGSLTYSSSNTKVASVNSSTGAVTLGTPGTAVITASYAGDANYAPSSASYTVVVAPAGTATTYTPSSSSAITPDSYIPENSTATYSNTYATNQLTAGKTATLTLSGYEGCIIKCIKLNMKSNGSAGAGTFSAVVGTGGTATTIAELSSSTTFDHWFDNNAYTGTYKDVLVEMTNTSREVTEDEDVVITISCTTNSLYINSYTIYYTYAREKSTAPTISPIDGTMYTEAQQGVTLSAAAGASIYYTLDGTKPTNESTLYTAPFNITETKTVKAVAYETNKRPSDVVTATITRNCTINYSKPEGGSYTIQNGSDDPQNVTAAGSMVGGEGNTITMTSTSDPGYKLHSTPFVVTGADESNIRVSKDGDTYTFTMPNQAVTVTAQYVPVYTISAGTFEHGAIAAIKDASGNAITETSRGSTVKVEASEDTHWTLSGMYFIKENDATATHNAINENNGVYSFTMPQCNVTVYATYTEDTKYAVSWMVNGAEVKHEEVYADVPVSAPAVGNVNGKVFKGWVETEINTPQNDAPSYTTVSNLMVNQEKVFYAVFATQNNGSTDVDITMDAITKTKEGVTIACAKANGGSAPTWTSNECRVYASNTITISASSAITAFSLTFHKQGSKDYISSMTASTGTYVSGGASTSGDDNKTDTWSGSATSITLTAGSTGQRVLVGGTVTIGAITYSDYTTTLGGSSVTLVATNGDNYYATFSSAESVKFDANTTVYTANVEDGVMSLNEVENKQVPANTGVLIKNVGTTANYNYISAPAALENNMLRAASVVKEATGYKFYMLAYGDAELTPSTLGFYWGAADGGVFDSREGSAYLAVPVSGAGAPAHFLFEDEEQTATAIETVEAIDEVVKFVENGQVYILRAGVVYDIMGRVIR